MTTINTNVILSEIKSQESSHRSSHVKPFKRDAHLSTSHGKQSPKNLFDLIEEENEEGNPLTAIPLCPSISALELSSPSTAPIGSPHLPVDIEALFEKMAGSMIILSSSSETETSLFLDSPQFSASVFYGTKITIKEFSTAPKAFNVEISTSPLALARLEVHKAALLEAFQKGNFNFSIGRLDTGLQDEDRPEFHRKSPISNEEDDQRGEG